MVQARRNIIRHALRTGHNKVVAQAVVLGDPTVTKKLSVKERNQILQSVL
jgi:hypothetical protein